MIFASKSGEKLRNPLRHELHRRMSRPQRHRLLQGYPMAPLLRTVRGGFDPLRGVELDPARPLIVGILPHTFCNPKVKGCGFCTFPHEKFTHAPMNRVVEQVAHEIEHTVLRHPALRERSIDAVYFGGGTANLTPPAGMKRLLDCLASAFDLRGTELTLEGVPKYFLLHDEALLDLLASPQARHRRISMGIQTFDREWLRRMGRDAFGNLDDVRCVVESAHQRGFTVSADLLFNLPGAPAEQSLADVRTAIELGLDQICVYNLVLTADLDTEWARDVALVSAMPDAARALASWLAIRETLLEQGYTQTTLTNFERTEVAQSPRRFIYELASFDPAARDGLGFGPGALSTFTWRDHEGATKWRNLGTSEAFTDAMSQQKNAVASVFDYAPEDMRLLHLTRNLARLQFDCSAYERFFGTNPFADFPSHFEVLEEARLVRFEGRVAHLTPEGMFYADSIAGLLAHRRVQTLHENDERAARYHMG
ncbi:radical SAM protein [Hyalangium versicolor]|uniref:radical SAM protein n=1 Tax=Hyalangium versicolor TaxID=2861190 RepID=UPI001CCB8DBB|nr:radical SAM protein [Hyalangium versicolor]